MRDPGKRVVAMAELRAGWPNSEVWWLDNASLFWQIVFLSLLEDSGPAVCQVCGAILGDKTPKGRKKRQTVCKRCRWREWWGKQSKDRKRARWRADYRQRSGQVK
jgi:hypothetical protein